MQHELSFKSVESIAEEAQQVFKARLHSLELNSSNADPVNAQGLDGGTCLYRWVGYPKSGGSSAEQFLLKVMTALKATVRDEEAEQKRGAYSMHDTAPLYHGYHCVDSSMIAMAHILPWDSYTLYAAFCLWFWDWKPNPIAGIIMPLRDVFDTVISRALHQQLPMSGLQNFGINTKEYEMQGIQNTGKFQGSMPEELQRKLIHIFTHTEIFAVIRWQFAMRAAARDKGISVLTLEYEQLLTEPVEWLRKALAFCNIYLEATLLELLVSAYWRPKPGQIQNSGRVAPKYRDVYSDQQMLWMSSVLQSWDPSKSPWHLQETNVSMKWPIHAGKRFEKLRFAPDLQQLYEGLAYHVGVHSFNPNLTADEAWPR